MFDRFCATGAALRNILQAAVRASLVRALTWLLIVVVVAIPASASAQTKTGQEQLDALRKRLASVKQTAIVFFIAKGGPNSCGEGCDTWIAADGAFDADAPERLRKLLSRSPQKKFPIYFASPGGNGNAAMEIGRLLRQRKMTASVARTIPTGCTGSSRTTECERLKRSGEELPSRLQVPGAACSSACVYALVGASIREIPPQTKLGVHAGLNYLVRRDSGAIVGISSKEPEAFRKRFRNYLSEMGIAVALQERASRVPHESMEYLTREEIIRFKIDTREFVDATWYVQYFGATTLVTKFFYQGAAADYARPSYIGMACERGGQVSVRLDRPLRSSESEVRSIIKMTGLDPVIVFPHSDENGLSLQSSVRAASVSARAFEWRNIGPSVEMTETFLPQDANSWSKVTKLSTTGLSESLGALTRSCR